MRNYSLKEKAGCMLFDVPRLLPAFFLKDQWISAWNRREALKVENGGVDTTAIGACSSDIYACHVFPWIGRRLMRNAFSEWPIRFADRTTVSGKPEVSFVLPHRGKDRLPLLKFVISSILAQEGVSVECIVVEQNTVQEISGLPDDVRYVHLPHPEDPAGWHKSWAFNNGVRMARADIVVCHDSDILVPMYYAREIVKRISEAGNEVAHLHRFLFCLDKLSTKNTLNLQDRVSLTRSPVRVRQHWKGGTLAITRKAYFRIGGFDEEFVNWGGEDDEFFDRCVTLKSFRRGYLPFIHLWHDSQQSKGDHVGENNLRYLRELLDIPRKDRINKLLSRCSV